MRIAHVTETFPPEINGVTLTAQRTEQQLLRVAASSAPVGAHAALA